ncbi:hypothetical protein CRG98_029231 [Punica granatum]|uniref:Uncharacterized protein n=1 Tax=Punica granatum TaxID=22663 RepID=A0A2I0J2W9_PUNGR|nr:hypothetical protein CRG98_029231 [Punica granatum]
MAVMSKDLVIYGYFICMRDFIILQGCCPYVVSAHCFNLPALRGGINNNLDYNPNTIIEEYRVDPGSIFIVRLYGRQVRFLKFGTKLRAGQGPGSARWLPAIPAGPKRPNRGYSRFSPKTGRNLNGKRMELQLNGQKYNSAREGEDPEGKKEKLAPSIPAVSTSVKSKPDTAWPKRRPELSPAPSRAVVAASRGANRRPQPRAAAAPRSRPLFG